jgi:hypothetical protein
MLAFLSLSFVAKNGRAILIIGGVVAILVFGAHERLKGYSQGKSAATQQIEKANDREMRRATSAAKTVEDCAASGGDWVRGRGVCIPVSAGQ